jgi:hypothetical protein
MKSFEFFIVINTSQTIENIFNPYLQLCEIGSTDSKEMHELARCSVHSV